MLHRKMHASLLHDVFCKLQVQIPHQKNRCKRISRRQEPARTGISQIWWTQHRARPASLATDQQIQPLSQCAPENYNKTDSRCSPPTVQCARKPAGVAITPGGDVTELAAGQHVLAAAVEEGGEGRGRMRGGARPQQLISGRRPEARRGTIADSAESRRNATIVCRYCGVVHSGPALGGTECNGGPVDNPIQQITHPAPEMGGAPDTRP